VCFVHRIFTVKYSGDAKYVLSGSDDTNIRVWKAQASMPIKPLVGREKAKLNYANKLKERFKNAPEILRIARYNSGTAS
jgi:WD repeat and SOF domain-containing protein 1